MPKNKAWDTDDWVRFLKEQADYTKEYRHNLYTKVDIKNKMNILDVGCGTGAITADIASLTKGCITGIDIDGEPLERAKKAVHGLPVTLVNADVQYLPFMDETFDLVVFSVVLMYVKNQQKAVNEMARVTCKDGIVLATMEPDYAGELHYPESEADLLFKKRLKEAGADLYTGRKLRALFSRAGLKTEIGIYAEILDNVNKDTAEQLKEFQDYFWSVEKDLRSYGWTDNQIEKYKQEQVELIENNVIFGFVPTFYAIGRK